MKGITLIKDETHNKRFVQIDVDTLQKFEERVEDLLDAIIAESRKDEKIVSWEAVKKIRIAIDGLAFNPRPDGCKKLSDSDENIWRIRVGDYRILYIIQDEIKIIDIRRIAHRKDVYR